MKIITLIALLIPLIFGGCSGGKQSATKQSAERFVVLFREELAKLGTLESKPLGDNEANGILMSGQAFTLPAGDLPSGWLTIAVNDAWERSGGPGRYSISGYRGRERYFRMHYGSNRSHAFIDIVSYPYKDRSRVDVLFSVVE